MHYIIATLGCKVNQYETQAMETELKKRGHAPVDDASPADIVIVNTCAVTAESGRKSRQTIRHLVDENPGAVAGVCGCYSQLSPDEAEEAGATVVYGTGDRLEFIQALEKAATSGKGTRKLEDPFKRRDFERLSAGAVNGRTRAMLKIQDGCVNFCSYCIIPYTRGRLRSLPMDEAARQTAELASKGYMELVLTGIEVASYGADLPGRPGLKDVITACAEASGEMRIRLGSLEPTVITEDFCAELAGTGKLCRHFHLSLQSGCDRTLKAMNRKYDTAFFLSAVKMLRKYFPGCAITCDLITGFPGETEEDFANTLEFIQECAFSAMHIFPYSRRPGTPADKMPDQCTNAVKSQRAERAKKIADAMHQSFLNDSVGQTLPVLFETEKDGLCTGHSDTYVLVSVPGTGLRNKILDVKITAVDGNGLKGEVV